ncbi:mitochondrial protein Pet127-domain-containing protein [Neohortaea acidophila]|uniref:Mitochondrial protein Pet127-domain-containing protein n=1 Tax=Neohortaea acidophila TaxID=245834 RepID=A0A6A6PZ55_9PEZI|nr:mitochondrial protein Pet127-domain-containing protein [Neohortaea acidophila]KAF2484733.1 mitochondrial protein Pet127-domain-containing protein [Neohortaea acidophila]
MLIRHLSPGAPLWNSSGYVCRACRHQLLASRTQSRRWESTLFSTQHNPDDAADHFNNLVGTSPLAQLAVVEKASSNLNGSPSDAAKDKSNGGGEGESTTATTSAPSKMSPSAKRRARRQKAWAKRLQERTAGTPPTVSNTSQPASAASSAHPQDGSTASVLSDVLSSLSKDVDDRLNVWMNQRKDQSPTVPPAPPAAPGENQETSTIHRVRSRLRVRKLHQDRVSVIRKLVSPLRYTGTRASGVISRRRRRTPVFEVGRARRGSRLRAAASPVPTTPSVAAPQSAQAAPPIDNEPNDRGAEEHKPLSESTNQETAPPLKITRQAKSSKRVKRAASASPAKSPEQAATSKQNKSAPISKPSNGDAEEHKPLWEVMSQAGILSDKTTSKATSSAKAKRATQASPSDSTPSGPSPSTNVITLQPSALNIKPLDIPQPAVPGLAYGLDRVLFNPGVYQLQDPLSRVFNFDPYLQNIMPPAEFDFNALKQYKTSSQDSMLSTLAQEHGKRYIGSTSSMTSTLAHFHFLLSDWRPVNVNMMSQLFAGKSDTFTQINRAPNAIFLRWKDGTYAIDADKEFDSGNVLMLLGKSMEKLLTMPKSEYERYRKSDPREVTEEERTAPEPFQYTTMGDFLMRSQLDAHDPRLPGTGTFDLKTRAVLSVRMDAENFEPMTGYEIHTLQGRFGSYEREYHDMIRATMLKYMLQVRMGRMDGIFVAYHNVERIFGFQYIPLQDMDRALHGQFDPCLGDQEFKTSLALLNEVLDKATARFPEQSLRFHFETTNQSVGSTPTTVMWVFGEAMEEEQIEEIQATSKARVAKFERTMMGMEKESETPTSTSHAEKHDKAADSSAAATEEDQSAQAETAPAPGPASDTNSSQSDADVDFLDSIASSPTLDSPARKPLFAASIICKTKVNGVAASRPEHLKPTDKWEVEYVLREWPESEAMWARYEAMKERRRDIFERVRDEEADEAAQAGGNGHGQEVPAKQRRDRHFIEFLRSMSRTGREFRQKMDKADAGRKRVVFGWEEEEGT